MYKYECETYGTDNAVGHINASSEENARELLKKRNYVRIISVVKVPYKANLL